MLNRLGLTTGDVIRQSAVEGQPDRERASATHYTAHAQMPSVIRENITADGKPKPGTAVAAGGGAVGLGEGLEDAGLGGLATIDPGHRVHDGPPPKVRVESFFADGEERAIRDCWNSQVAYWVYEDVFATIKALNGSSATFRARLIAMVSIRWWRAQGRAGRGRKIRRDPGLERGRFAPKEVPSRQCAWQPLR